MAANRVLVAYATRAGSTAEVAQVIAEVLRQHGAAVDVRPVKEVSELSGYQAVVLGSAVRFGQWLPEMMRFLQGQRQALGGKPVAFFAVHLMNQGEEQASRSARLAYLDAARKLVTPQAEAYFSGVGDLSKVSLLDRLIGKAVKSPTGDFRDWPAIRAWAKALAEIGFATLLPDQLETSGALS